MPGHTSLHLDLLAETKEYGVRVRGADRTARLRVRVAGSPEELPDIAGSVHEVDDGVRFVPHFPFVPGTAYRATIDGAADQPPIALNFIPPAGDLPPPPVVTGIYPSGAVLPENLLRFYVHFSQAMCRGDAPVAIAVLGADGTPAADVLYRAPAELWDPAMRRLTVLLDPGRLKRGVGPNRALGPPLVPGAEYTLEIGTDLRDGHGQRLASIARKPFRTAAAIRDGVVPERWSIIPPPAGSRTALRLGFGRPLDRALLQAALTVERMGGELVAGDGTIASGDEGWNLIPDAPWVAGEYRLIVAPTIEDVCGNALGGAFDRPLRLGGDPDTGLAGRSIAFRIG